jgi:F0F1-type ATP synthase membrane subunit c/vacuolar-type H+-ATPase subunit K
MSEAEGKPFTNTIIAMGIAETVGIFAFVFMFMLLP